MITTPPRVIEHTNPVEPKQEVAAHLVKRVVTRTEYYYVPNDLLPTQSSYAEQRKAAEQYIDQHNKIAYRTTEVAEIEAVDLDVYDLNVSYVEHMNYRKE